MLSFERAQALLIEAGEAPAGAERVGLGQARGRVLAQAFMASLDMPPADNSSMDGYAIRGVDWRPDAVLPVQQRCYAGDEPQPLKPGCATRLFTGSLMPAGADTIVIQENCVESPQGVRILEPGQAGQYIRRRAEDVAAGSCLLEAGVVLGAAELALLAAQGATTVSVRPQLRIGILTTGDEIVAPGAPIATHQIYNSNAPLLASLIEGIGAQVSLSMHARDDADELAAALSRLAACSDIVLSAGGVSVGERDLVKPVLESLGGELALWKVRMKPGKPVALGRVQGCPVVCLPGNPVSVFAVFTVLVSPMLRRMQGRTGLLPVVHSAVLRARTAYGDSRTEFLRVQAQPDEQGRICIVPHAGQSSGIMSALPWATGLARVPAGEQRVDGDVLEYYDFRHWLK